MTIITVEILAQKVNGEVRGNPALPLDGAAALEKAGPRDVTFAVDEQNIRRLPASRAAACIVSRTCREHALLGTLGMTLVFVDDPMDAFVAAMREFRPAPARPKLGISPEARIDPTATIGPDCNIHAGAHIGAGCVLGNRCDVYPGVYIGEKCRIGDDCVLHPHVVLYPEVILGNRVILHASAVIGADGFGYRFRDGRYEKIPQLGWVHVQDDCEIGACTTVDRGMIGPTVIGLGTKLDNLVMIGHNCELGKHNAFASQVGLAGSVTTGDYVRCAGQVGVADHVHLGRACTLGAKAGVHKDMEANGTYIGVPARPEQEQFRIVMAAHKLPDMRRQLREMEARLEELEKQASQVPLPQRISA